ncbi:MAG: acyl dehydratase [Tetrasphaera sp.]|jgi:acyl dehydratase|nr:acyl dehydratase [Tetrasphaera sp.]
MARAFDSVNVGDDLGTSVVRVTRQTLVDYAAASLDQNPIHQDEAFAKSVGLPDVIAHGMWTMGAAGTLAADWAGDAGRVLRYGTRFTSMVVVPPDGADLEVSGVVKSLDPQTRRATVELTASAAGVKVLGRCTAEVQLD